MAAAPPGILRRPRYSSSSSSSSSAASSTATDNAVIAVDVTSSPHHHLPPPATVPINSGYGESRKYPLRTLAEMVKSVTDLNNELVFNSVDDVIINTHCDDDCNIVHYSKSTSASLSSGERLRTTTTTADDSSDEHHDPLLLISNDGTPYMNINIISSPPNVDADNNNTKNPIIAAAAATIGVMGENGQGCVRFCEYEESNEGKNNIMTTTTIRDRLVDDQSHVTNVVLKKGRQTNNNNNIDIDETADSDTESYDGSADGGDEDILQELGMSNFFNNDNNQDDEEEYDYVIIDDQHHVRPFRVLWEILTRWATPSTVELGLTYQRIQQYEQQTLQQNNDDIHEHGGGSSNNETTTTEPRNDVDIGASRQAGIMSMLKMHVPRALAELQRIQQQRGVVNQKLVEQRLANLVRTFEPSVPAINLSTKLWKGLTTILIAIACPNITVANDDSSVLPPSILVLNMTAAEYRYLTCSVYTSLCSMD